MSVICSFNHSISFRAEKANSSASAMATCKAEARSSDIHDVDPTCSRGFARVDAIVQIKTNRVRDSRFGIFEYSSRTEDHEIIAIVHPALALCPLIVILPWSTSKVIKARGLYCFGLRFPDFRRRQVAATATSTGPAK